MATPGTIEDRWTVRGPGGKRVPASASGQGSRWVARHRGPDGREIKLRFGTRVAAQRWLDEQTAGKVRGDYVDERAGRITFTNWSARWLEAQVGLKPSTRQRYASILSVHLLPRFGASPIREISHADVAAMVAVLGTDGLSGSSVRQVHRVLSRILDFAVRNSRLSRNVAEGVPLPRAAKPEKRFLTMAQVLSLADAAGRDRLVILLLATTGMRFGELAALRVRRVDLLRRRIEIAEAVTEVNGELVYGTPKTHHRRSVPVPRSLVDDLAVAMAGKGPEDLALTSATGGPLRLMNWRRRVFDPAARGASLDGLTPHELRHTAASLGVSAGANVKAVQRLLGHASAAMTLDVYSGLFDDDLEAVGDRLEARLDAAVETSRKHRPVSDLSRAVALVPAGR